MQLKEPDAFLISSHHSIVYLTGFDHFQVSEREAYLFIVGDKKYIITDSRYSEAVSEHIKDFELIEVASNLPHHLVIQNLIDKHQVETLGIEEDNLTVKEFSRIHQYVKTVHHSPARGIKSSEEVTKIQKACQLGDKTFEYMLTIIKPGKSEIELAWEMEKYVRDQRATFSFHPIIAFNEHAAMPHHKNTSDELQETSSQLILMDFGVKVENYCSDMTRVVFLGQASQEQKKVYHSVLESHQKAAEFLAAQLKSNKKVRGKEVDRVAREHIKSKGFASYGHGLGHGIGLEVHEAPRLSINSEDELKSGMVFSIEPGIYLPGKFGVRIEDLYWVNGKELIQLTTSSKKIIQL